MMDTHTQEWLRISAAIARMISGEATADEERQVESWAAASEANRRLFRQLHDSSRLRQRVEDWRRTDWEEAYRDFLAEKTRIEGLRRRRRIGRMMRYAALWILPLGVAALILSRSGEWLDSTNTVATALPEPGRKYAVLYLSDGQTVELREGKVQLSEQNGTRISGGQEEGLVYRQEGRSDTAAKVYNTLRVPANGEFCMQLADGSKVWVGACSELKYPVAFDGKTREVFLLEGEAFFEVAKNPERPFVVRTKDFSVKALGTSFNVMNYREEHFSHATLKTGRVEVATAGEKLILSPGEQAFYSEGRAEVRKVDVEVYTAWMGDAFRFDKESLEVILRKLARWYDVEVVYTHEELKHYHFKGKLPKYADIREVLDLLGQTTSVEFQVDGRRVIVSEAERNF